MHVVHKITFSSTSSFSESLLPLSEELACDETESDVRLLLSGDVMVVSGVWAGDLVLRPRRGVEGLDVSSSSSYWSTVASLKRPSLATLASYNEYFSLIMLLEFLSGLNFVK